MVAGTVPCAAATYRIAESCGHGVRTDGTGDCACYFEQGGKTTNKQRVGIGHDTHRLGVGGPLILGGIEIPHDHHAIGHSDADVLLHAITDAILGAAALGDIGEMFPDTDEVNRDRDSAEMLRIALAKLQEAKFRIINLDCIVFAQRPKLSTLKTQLCHHIAHLVGIEPRGGQCEKQKLVKAWGPLAPRRQSRAQCVTLIETTETEMEP